MCGCGSGAILEALPTPLGSTATLFIPPAFAGPRAIPLIGTFPIAPEPAGRANPPIAPKPPCPPPANEAAGAVRIMSNAIATFTDVLDMRSASTIHGNGRSREAHVASQSADAIKLNFINRILRSVSWRVENPPAAMSAPPIGTRSPGPAFAGLLYFHKGYPLNSVRPQTGIIRAASGMREIDDIAHMLLVISILLEASIAAIAVLAARQGRPYLYGLAFTFIAYVIYDLARFMRWAVEGPLLSGLFLLASVTALVAVWGLYRNPPGK